MLARGDRLSGQRIPLVLAGKVIYRDANLVIKALPNQLARARLGVIVSARFLPLAVKRNRLKRQLLAIINPQKITPGFDVVVMIKK